MAEVVIADAGPLIAFAGIDRLHVLNALFGRLRVTESVRAECFAKPGQDTDRIGAAVDDGWIQVVTCDFESLSTGLGAGESDSIQLALQAPEETLLILDDRLARRFALRSGLKLVGTARLLLIAEKKGVVEDARLCVTQMAGLGYRISLEVLDRIRGE